MSDLDRITIVLETLPGARAQVSVNIDTPTPGMRLATPAHVLAIDALGWLGKQPCVAGFVYAPATPAADAMDAVRQAVRDYHCALDFGRHGGVAAGKALDAIQDALGMHWERGAESKARAIESTAQGAAA